MFAKAVSVHLDENQLRSIPASRLLMVRTLAIHDFLCITCECCPSTFRRNIKLLGVSPKVLSKRPQRAGADSPRVLCCAFIEQSMHHLD